MMSSNSDRTTDDSQGLFHERQEMLMCAKHAINNFFQYQAVTKNQLDEIADRLSAKVYFSSHRSVLGIGNYDVNVIMAALLERGLITKWFDKRKFGIYSVTTKIASARHWTCIRRIRNVYYHFDSMAPAPSPIGDESEVIKYLQMEMEIGEKELLVIISKETDLTNSWCKRDFDFETTYRPTCKRQWEDVCPEPTDKNAKRQQVNDKLSRCIFLKNIPTTWKPKDIFGLSPDIKEISLQLRYNKNDQGKSYATLIFANEREAEKNFQRIHEVSIGNNIIVDYCGWKCSKQDYINDKKAIFIQGLACDATEEDLKTLLPNSTHIHIARSYIDDINLGDATVNFMTEEDAKLACITAQGAMLKGWILKVTYAIKLKDSADSTQLPQ